jgi:hypothetical protein
LAGVPLGKPRGFFRVCPNPCFRRRGEIYVHKTEGEIETSYYLIAPEMRGKLVEARPCVVITCVDRDGAPRLWPIMFPRESERDNAAWSTARSAARAALDRWVRLVWVKRAYKTVDAQLGYAPDPDWSKLPAFNELVRLGFGAHGIIQDENHAIYREFVVGAPRPADNEPGDDF